MKKKKIEQLPSIEFLADEIFTMVQHDQGRGFISDGMGVAKSQEQLFDWVESALYHTECSARIMRKWLKKRKYRESKVI